MGDNVEKDLGLGRYLRSSNSLGISGALSLFIAILLRLKGRKGFAKFFAGLGFALLYKWRDLHNGKLLNSIIDPLKKSSKA